MSSRHSRVALALVALAACKGAPPPAIVDEQGGSSGGAAVTGNVAVAGPARVVQVAAPTTVVMSEPVIALPRLESFDLLDAGTGARATLRYQLAAGAASFVAETVLSSRHLVRGAFTQPVKLPAIRDGFAITVTTELPGRLALRALPGQAATASPEAEAYLASWRQLQNRRMTVAVDDRGQLGTIAFNDDPTGARSEPARHDLAQRLLSTIVPLPVEPVGTGARWRVVTILKQGPAYAKQTATYTLIARSAAAWKVHVKLQRVAETQRLTDPALPAGTTAELIAMFRVLEGEVDLAPTQPMITHGTLTVESRLHVKLTAAGQAADPDSEQIFEDTGRVTLSRKR
jgi:hypothetical protein